MCTFNVDEIDGRGQFNNFPKDFFYKTWNEYVTGFGAIGHYNLI